MMKRNRIMVLMTVLGLLMMVACQVKQSTAPPTPSLTKTIASTLTEVPSSTPEPSTTPEPTAMPLPTETPTPEPTVEPTEIPVKKIPNLRYMDEDDSRHKLDLYLPEGQEGPFPTMLAILGIGQNRASMATQARYFARKGFATVVISYRDPLEHIYPAPVQDAFCALGWIHSNAAAYNFDPEHIFVTGVLYGATQGALIGTVDDPASYLAGCPHTLPETNWVRGTMMICGTFDYTYEDLRDYNDFSVPRSFGGSYEEAQALWEAGSPVTWADSNDPPLLWVCGEDTQDVPGGFAPMFDAIHADIEQRITQTGIPATVTLIPESTWRSFFSELTFAVMEEFLAENRN